ncbi:MAG: Multidrug resistance protein MdtA [Stenotrophomonas maltophilia]|uniref:Multidrug resistance protein MdtA n=1 Tax=Stenotrophomonas maltophilia TaxID=40324 RepID=A0A7V8FIZ4_STEMA|nr:MAG: Multidrug resistance protein MdtA [Stenotrophomonas maltophilia]
MPLPLPAFLLRRRSLAVASVLLLGLLLLLLFQGVGRTDAQPRSAPPPVPVVTAQVQQRDVSHWQNAVGSVQSLQSAVLRPQVDGVLTEVLFEEGQKVVRGQLLARIDDRAIRASLGGAQAAQGRDAATLQAAQSDLARLQHLSSDQLVSRQMLEQQAATVQQLQATGRGNQSAVEAVRVQLSCTRITSPLDGRIGLRQVDPGNLVRATDAQGLVTVQQTDPISVVFTLPQDRLPALRQALAVGAVPVQALDRDGGQRLAEGQLRVVDNQVDETSGTARLRAVFDNGSDQLWPGQLVSVRLLTGRSADALAVPAGAVLRGVDGAFVYRVGADGTVQPVPVTVGAQDADAVVVRGALQRDDTVVRDGQSRLRPGTAVVDAARPAAAAAAKGTP